MPIQPPATALTEARQAGRLVRQAADRQGHRLTILAVVACLALTALGACLATALLVGGAWLLALAALGAPTALAILATEDLINLATEAEVAARRQAHRLTDQARQAMATEATADLTDLALTLLATEAEARQAARHLARLA